MPNNISIIIDDNKDHEGKYLVEVIKSEGSKRFIKNYKLNVQQLLTLNESLSQNHQHIDIKYKSDECHTLIPSAVPNKYRHPEYRDQNLFMQNSFEETLNAKYGNYKRKVPKMDQSRLPELEAYNSIGNYNSYISQSSRVPKI